MRMGRPLKRRKSSPRGQAVNPSPPKFSSPTLEVGRVSSNVIRSVLGPELERLSERSVEEYADEALLMASSASNMGSDGGSMGGEEVELDPDGNIVIPQPPIIPPSSSSSLTRRLFSSQSDVDELASVLSETSSHFSTPGNAWKVRANAAKFERLLDEKYGRFRPFIEEHPQVEVFVKNLQRKYALGGCSPFKRREDMPFNKSTAIIMLVMMYRQKVRWEALVLAATFSLVGLQPWALVSLVALGWWEMERRKGRRVHGMPKKLKVCEPYYAIDGDGEEEKISEEEERARKHALLNRPVGEAYNPADLSLRDEKYDVLLLGSGAETLYAAALLARAGRRVCVLSPPDDASECIVMEKQTKDGKLFADVPFDARVANVAHLSKQQQLLAPALCTSTDTQGGIRFARVGSEVDGYAHSVMSVPGLGAADYGGDGCIPVVVNAGGLRALAEYCSSCLGDGYPGVDLDGNDDGNSTSLGYINACRGINASSGDYYLTKMYSSKGDDSNVYRQATLRPASAFLNRSLPYNPHVRSLMAALGGADENLSPDRTSMAAHVTRLCAATGEEGMAYPVGGPRALCRALASVVEQCGGRVVRGVGLQELLFEKLDVKEEDGGKKKAKKTKAEEKKDGDDALPEIGSGPKPRCRGVRLQNGCEVSVSEANGAVLSTLGLIPTFLHLVPADVRSAHGVTPGLPAVSERRPLIKLLVGLRGTREDLSLTGADWYRLPNASLPRDELDPTTGQVKPGSIGADSDAATEEEVSKQGGEAMAETATTAEVGAPGRGKRSKAGAASAASSTTAATAGKKAPRVKFASGHSWMKVSFPSAKDPSWPDRHGPISTCVVTVEADDDFVRMFDTKPKIYSILGLNSNSGDAERLRDRVLKDLVENFPQLQDKIECVQICGPQRAGLVQDPAKFAITGNRPSTPYPGLYVGGSDLTVSDSFSGAIVGSWLASNAVMGYTSFIDHLYLKKNVTSDLERFLDEPSMAVTDGDGNIVEDLAVPFTVKEVGPRKEDEGGANTNAAESTKEE